MKTLRIIIELIASVLNLAIVIYLFKKIKDDDVIVQDADKYMK